MVFASRSDALRGSGAFARCDSVGDAGRQCGGDTLGAFGLCPARATALVCAGDSGSGDVRADGSTDSGGEFVCADFRLALFRAHLCGNDQRQFRLDAAFAAALSRYHQQNH